MNTISQVVKPEMSQETEARIPNYVATMSTPEQQQEYVPPKENPMAGVPEHIRKLLDRLHAESSEQESKLTKEDFQGQTAAEVMRDKFIALDQDKSQFVYALCRATGARTIVEAGTSFGVSTIYLALAAAANAKAAPGGKPAKVIGTEHEATKAAKAREYWSECGDDVANVIDLREGDLRETLKENLEDVDLLLLDSMYNVSFRCTLKAAALTHD